MLWYERQGDQGPAVLLVHGLGATGAVWSGTVAALHARGPVRTLVVDLPGHGGSPWASTYSVGEMAAALAPLVRELGPFHCLGHSLGVYVGLALASSWFNCEVLSVTGIGPKLEFTDEDIARMRDLAARPAKYYPSRTEALERYRRASGLDAATVPDETSLARGVTTDHAGHRLAQDPATFLVGAPPIAGLIDLARCRIRLACGEHDSMVNVAGLRRLDPEAVELPELGHNAHAASPAAVLALVSPFLN